MHVPVSRIDPATAPAGRPYVIAFKDDDWDHWVQVADMLPYVGHRSPAGRWHVTSREGDPVDWTYADDEIVVIADV